MAQPPPDWNWIGAQVRERRESLNLSQAAVAAKVAASVTWLYQIEQAKGARERQPMKLAMLAEALRWPRDAFDYLKAGRLPPPAQPDTVIASDDRMVVLEAKVDRLIQLLEQSEKGAPSSPREAGRPSR